MAKLSEKHLRQEKVAKLKTKILAEIDDCKTMLKEYLLSYYKDQSELTDELFEDYITELYSLMQLKKFIVRPSTFMMAGAVYEDNDYIAYYVDDRDLDVWLQEDYKFVNNFILNMGDPYKGPSHLVHMLTENYFAYNFTNIFDLIEYGRKTEEHNNVNNDAINGSDGDTK